MHNVWLIARREYLERIRTKAFLIATILIPMLLGSIGFGSSYLASRTKSTATIVVLADDRPFAAELKHELETGKDSRMTIELGPNTPAAGTALDARLRDKKDALTGYLQVSAPSASGARPGFIYRPRSASDINTVGTLKDAIKAVLTRQDLAGRGLDPAAITTLMAPVTIDTSETGDTATAFFAAYAMFFLMYFVIMQFGMNTARSIIEEKTSRVFEVLLATITPDEMLAGKILGVGAVGLTQVGVWLLAAAAAGTYFGALAGSGTHHALVTPTQMIFFVLYFLFGFIIYSSIAAALGAMTNSEQELQQLNMFLVIPLALSSVGLVAVINSPDAPLSRVLSLIPFSSPLLMNFRISAGNPQVWEIALSFILMSLLIAATLWFASRIYRVGILMYGKKPNLPEILRWLRYS